jgi:hypothetical protein
MRARTRWIAGLSAAAILLTATVTASGYTGQVEGTVGVAVRGTVTCDAPFTLEATILDTAGAPMVGASVDWTWVTRPSTSDKIDRTPTVTNANGVATTTLSLAAVNGERKVRATSGEVSGTVVVTQACGGLPRTDTSPAETPGGGVPIAVLLLVAAGLVGGALTLRRTA